jgi:hypothetical protein
MLTDHQCGFVQVPQMQEPKEKTPEVVEETQPSDETVIEETPVKETPKPSTPKPQDKSPDALKQQQQIDPALAVVIQNKPLSQDPKTGSKLGTFSKDPKTGPKPGTSKNTAFEISDSQTSNDSSSSDSDLPKAPTSISRTIRPFNDSDDGDDNAGVGGAGPSTAAIRPLATTTATKTVGGGDSGKPPRSTGSKDGGPTRRRTNFLGTALDALNSISGGVTGSKRRSGEGTGEEPAEKRPRGENDHEPSVLGDSAA